MSEPYVGEIRMFAGNFAPIGWAMCDGQLLAVSQNDALFSLLGTMYGGDGRTTFGLPDMRGRVPLHQGSGSGLTPRTIGSKVGQETVTLTTQNLPKHTHSFNASTAVGTQVDGAGQMLAASPNARIYRPTSPAVGMATQAIAHTGGSADHTNVMPALGINFIIALFGIYPSRN